MPANATSKCKCGHGRFHHDLRGRCGGYIQGGKPTTLDQASHLENVENCSCLTFDWQPAGSDRSRALAKARREVYRETHGHSGLP